MTATARGSRFGLRFPKTQKASPASSAAYLLYMRFRLPDVHRREVDSYAPSTKYVPNRLFGRDLGPRARVDNLP